MTKMVPLLRLQPFLYPKFMKVIDGMEKLSQKTCKLCFTLSYLIKLKSNIILVYFSWFFATSLLVLSLRRTNEQTYHVLGGFHV